ncbi:MAG: P-loop NTPase fold protein, partial [Candidatus Angelobacter sp.]
FELSGDETNKRFIDENILILNSNEANQTKVSPGAHPTPKVDSDIWCMTDRLGYEPYARTIASLISSPDTLPPLTIGIKAPWGAGKTSLMKRVQHLLDGDAQVTERNETGARQLRQTSEMTLWELLQDLKSNSNPDKLVAKTSEQGRLYGLPARMTVWFNAWKYQTSEQIWAGMAHCIISQITARMDAKQRELFWLRLHAKRIKADEVRWRIYETLAREALPFLIFFLAVACLATIIPIPLYFRGAISFASLVPAVYRTFRKLSDSAAGSVRDLIREPGYEGKMGFLYLVESDIRDVLDLASVTDKIPLIIFVDDLDRCVPHKVAEVVEAINLFLCGDYPNCIFVLAMEPGMVAAALQAANKDVIEKAEEMAVVDTMVPMGWRFMEKIVQLPVIMAPPTSVGLESYAKWLMTDLDARSALPENGHRSAPAALGSETTSQVPEVERKIQNWVRLFKSPTTIDQVVKMSDDLLKQVPVEERWAAAEASKRVFERTFTDRDPAIKKFITEIMHLVGGNPRQIKRYVNVFRFYSALRHSLRVDAAAQGRVVNLPVDEGLAKFVALSINWPHAIDCLRLRGVNIVGNTPEMKSLLAILEEKSKSLEENGSESDREWAEFLDKNGLLLLGKWVSTRPFRQFLARGESICEIEGHGLW